MSYQEEYEDTSTDVTVVDSTPVQRSLREAGRDGLSLTVMIATLGFIILLVYLLWLVQAYLVYLGYLVLFGAGAGIIAVFSIPVTFAIRYLMKASYHTITPHGIAFRDAFGRVTTIAPLSPRAQGAGAPRGKREITPVSMLSMFDMIEQKIIYPGNTQVVMGYLPDGELVIAKRANTLVIAGKGRSGKTRRAILMLGQDLIGIAPLIAQGARIILCDPHGAGKADSFTKVIAPLLPWVTIATGEQEIARVTGEFSTEMEKRLAGTSELVLPDGSYLPWVLYYDEWSRLMSDKYSDETIAAMQTCVQSCAQEYAGVQGFVTLIGQAWTNDACGGTAIRRAIQEACVHQISSEYAQFLIKPRKWYVKAEELRVRDCLYKNYEGQVVQIVTPAIPDDTPARLAQILQEIAPVSGQVQELASPRDTGAQEFAQGYRAQELAQGSPYPLLSSPSREHSPQNEHDFIEAYEAVTEVNEPRGPVTSREDFTGTGETVTAPAPAIASPAGQNSEEGMYTPEKELAILNARGEIAQAGETVTREAIMKRLGWNRKQWTTIKAVCDKWQIAVR